MTDPNAPQLDPDLAALRRVAAAILRDSASADDIVQEAWLASVGKEGRSPEERRNWLRGVVRNLAK